MFEKYIRVLTDALSDRANLTVEQSARDDAEQSLENRLNDMASHVMKDMVVDILSKENPLVALDFNMSTSEERKRALSQVQLELKEGKRSFPELLCEKFDMASSFHARLIGEMLDRLSQNVSEISKPLLKGAVPRSVCHISGAAGDLHNGGRATLIVETDVGKLLYKPHDCRSDAYFRVLTDTFLPDTAVVPNVVAIGNEYGFCEFITAQTLNTPESAARYYERFGRLSALLLVLGSTDFHYENILCAGEYPAPIDLETILSTEYKNVLGAALQKTGFSSEFTNSLYISSILPIFKHDKELSPLVSTEKDNLAMPETAQGEKLTADRFLDEYISGFQSGYRHLMENRDALKKALDGFGDAYIRRLMRNTNDYMKFLRRSYMPDKLASVEAQESIVTILKNGSKQYGVKEVDLLSDLEAIALRRGDVPYFYQPANSCDLVAYGEPGISGYFEKSPVDTAKERIDRMNEADLAFQVEIIHNSFSLRMVAITPKNISQEEIDYVNAADEITTAADAMREAQAIFHAVADSVVTAVCGEKNWLSIGGEGYLVENEPWLLKGTVGICVFLAAYDSLTDDDGEKATALSLLHNAMPLIHGAVKSFENAKSIPSFYLNMGMDGFGGFLTGLSLIYRYTGLEEYMTMARRLMDNLHKLEPDDRTGTDLYSGAAGAIMSLCGFSEYRQHENARALVRTLADRLLATKTLQHDDLLLWDTLHMNRPISGAGHGQIGIGAALCRAGELLGEEKYFAAAADAFRFEHNIYSEKLKSWPDFRTLPADRAMHGLCSGAPGIGLMLLTAESYRDVCISSFDADLARATNAVMTHPMLYRDHLCCGNSGAADFLMELSLRHDDRRYFNAAASLLSGMVRRKNKNGGYSLMPPDRKSVVLTDLFFGISGIGYELLRFASPKTVPSVFLQEQYHDR